VESGAEPCDQHGGQLTPILFTKATGNNAIIFMLVYMEKIKNPPPPKKKCSALVTPILLKIIDLSFSDPILLKIIDSSKNLKCACED
jgi:hypothetical protein